MVHYTAQNYAEERTVSLYEAARDKPYYGSQDGTWDPTYSKDPYILEWWTQAHDALLPPLIEKYRWLWNIYTYEEVVRITPQSVLEAWRTTAPLCQEYAWYNVLNCFAGSRAQELGFLAAMREPRWKACPLCEHDFVEDSLPGPLIARMGLTEADFDEMKYCPICLINSLPECGSSDLSREEILDYLRELSDVLHGVPSNNFGMTKQYFLTLTSEEKLTLLKVLRRKPTLQRVKELFNSWLNALVHAGILEDGTRRMARGTRCLATDGHLCHSLAEKTIDDLLHSRGVTHEKEPRYPEGPYQACSQTLGSPSLSVQASVIGRLPGRACATMRSSPCRTSGAL